jgi:uncharacterized protein
VANGADERKRGDEAMLDTLDASAVRRWSVAAADALNAHRSEIDALNVFPVPDRDTGTNLALTLQAAAAALEEQATDTAAHALEVMARGAVLGARGNAGVIVSQILRGLAEGVGEQPAPGHVDRGCDGPRLQEGLRAAARRAYAAVAQPLEGTILSVARAAADAAQGVRGASSGLSTVVTAALGGAVEALRRTPEQLPVLARAGVVDAGGRGLVVVLDALATIVTGRISAAGSAFQSADSTTGDQPDVESARYGYEVQYLLAASENEIRRLRSSLARVGDSVVTAGTGQDEWAVHVHVDDVGAAIEAALDVGRPRRITVTRFADQTSAQLAGSPAAAPAQPAAASAARRSGVAVMALAPGRGLVHLFRAEGTKVVGEDPTSPPSVGDVVDAIVSARAQRAVLLPNTAELFDVAEAAADRAQIRGVEVAVVPTRCVIQGLAAVAVHDSARPFQDDVIAMVEAAAATRWAEVVIADREALTSVGRCSPGDVLGLIVGEVVEIGNDLGTVARAVLDRLLGSGGELVTVVADDAGQSAVHVIREHLERSQPLVEMTVYDGGESNAPLLIGVE